ncbi:NlpC/P60 family protein [Thermoplasmatota archaeon]
MIIKRGVKNKLISIFVIEVIIFSFLFINPVSGNKLELKNFEINKQPVLPKNIKIGDLVFIESISFFHNICNSWDHVAMYIGNNQFIEANDYSSIPPPIGGTSGVQITPLWKYKLWTQYCTFGTVKNTSENQRQAAVNWAIDQIEDGNFQKCWGDGSWWANANPNDKNDPDSNKWYCAELIWAAYYNTSNGTIDLDITPGPLQPPTGDGIHYAVNPQNIASHNDIIIYANKEAPNAPSTPNGELKRITLPQIGKYSTFSTNNSDKELAFQWVWGDSYKPDKWGDFIEIESNTTIEKNHQWVRINIHDKKDQNFVFDVRVRCKDKKGRISNWSKPLPIHVTPNNYDTDWITPIGYIDNDWNGEENIIDEKLYKNAVYKKIRDVGWSDSPLILTLNESKLIKGFRIKANTDPFINEMKISFYNKNEYIINFTYYIWPNMRWKIIDLHRYKINVDRVEINFHIDSTLQSLGFFLHPICISGFSFWEYKGWV